MLFLLIACVSSQYILDNEMIIHQSIKIPDLFCFNTAKLELNQKYEVKVSFLGSIGLDIRLFWKDQYDEFFPELSNYKPLDTAKLRFVLKDYSEETKCFYVYGFQISRSVGDPLKDGFDYIIRMDPILIDNITQAYLNQYIFVIVGGLIGTFIIWLYDQRQKRNKDQ
ncbi:hypothetical protein pb186bvf_016719 [Paramecium bursaria]